MHDGEGGNHYKENGTTEVIVLMEQVAKQVLHAEIYEIDLSQVSQTVAKKRIDDACDKAMNASYGMKHLARVGTKDIASVDSELLKAENYIHRARTGEWIQ